MIKQLLPAGVALAAGILFGRWFFGGAGEAPLPPLDSAGYTLARQDAGEPLPPVGGARSAFDADHADPEFVARLADALTRERQARERLEERLAAMETLVSGLEREVDGLGESLDPQALANAALVDTIDEMASRQAVDPRERSIRRFMEAGFTRERAETLKAQQDQLALDRLFLRDRARREGWLGSARYREEMARLDESQENLRAELGDDDFDRYLYATGRPNRIVVRETLTGGPAAAAGLQPGDVIVSYGGQRIFDTGTLAEQTRAGNFGESMPVEIERNGERLVLYVPRGPLGVNMRASVRKPDR